MKEQQIVKGVFRLGSNSRLLVWKANALPTELKV